MEEIIKYIAKKEIEDYKESLSMMVKTSLSVRAKYQDKGEHNNYRIFDKKEAVTNLTRLIDGVYFITN